MKKTLAFIFILFLNYTYKAQQNLVPNGSFELFDTCPANQGQVNYYVKNWFDPTYTSSDYYNSCSANTITGVPNNFYGTKYPYSENGMAGFVTYNSSLLNYREYIGVKLKESLQLDKKYCISFYISVSESGKYSTNNIGVLLKSDTTNIHTYFFSNINLTPTVIDTNTYSDPNKWEKLEFEFNNNSNSSFIIIGNFHSDNSIKKNIINNSGYEGAYYYIDNISITECGSPNESEQIITTELITPNGDNKNDIFNINASNLKNENFSIQIFNRWGNLIYKSTNKNFIWDGKYKENKCSTSTYYYLLEAENIKNKKIIEKGYIQLIN